MVATQIEFFRQLSEHIPEEAARLIVEEMTTESRLATKLDALATKDQLHAVELSIERLRSSMFRWQLVFFVPLWVGVYATLAAILFRGSV